MTNLQNAISKFNDQFGTKLFARINLYGDSIKIELHYNESKDSIMFFNLVSDAINNINQTFNIWMDAK
jgi:hypothetical protein